MIGERQLQIVRDWKSPRVVRIVVARVQGSAPREAGAQMWVAAHGFEGTIGGGRLEYEALAQARKLLARSPELANWHLEGRSWPLGPELGQCCGGRVELLFELVSLADLEKIHQQIIQADPLSLVVHGGGEQGFPRLFHDRHDLQDLSFPAARIVAEILRGERPRESVGPGNSDEPCWFVEPLPVCDRPLFVYGAGHVGRAIVKCVEDLDFALTWVDTHEQRFPAGISPKVTGIAAKNPCDIAQKAPIGAYHLILTYSHEIDFDLCRVLLAANRFGYLGLIGSKTKRSRFIKRLQELGIGQEALSRLTCPIGFEQIKGKQPARIAVSVAAQLLQTLEAEQCAQIPAERSAHVLAK